jgi:hypothetical protein
VKGLGYLAAGFAWAICGLFQSSPDKYLCFILSSLCMIALEITAINKTL